MSEELKKWKEKASKGIYETNQEKWNISTVWDMLSVWSIVEHRLSSKLDIAINALKWYSQNSNNDAVADDAIAKIEKIG